MSKVLDFKRPSLEEMLTELREKAPSATGAISIILSPDGHAYFRISGFKGQSANFLVCGLLDWIKADLLKDLTDA
jgi:hypothetical protein